MGITVVLGSQWGDEGMLVQSVVDIHAIES